jgi:hypothetical protein
VVDAVMTKDSQHNNEELPAKKQVSPSAAAFAVATKTHSLVLYLLAPAGFIC